MCDPDWRDTEDEIRRRSRDVSPFTFAERVLAQVGIRLALGR